MLKWLFGGGKETEEVTEKVAKEEAKPKCVCKMPDDPKPADRSKFSAGERLRVVNSKIEGVVESVTSVVQTDIRFRSSFHQLCSKDEWKVLENPKYKLIIRRNDGSVEYHSFTENLLEPVPRKSAKK